MITNIKKFIEDIKELYPNFKLDSYNEEFSVKEKFEYFKNLNLRLREQFGRGYFKAKEVALEDDEGALIDLPGKVEALIIFSLYSSESARRDAIYRSIALQNSYIWPDKVVSSIVEEYFGDDCETEVKGFLQEYVYEYIRNNVYGDIPIETETLLCYNYNHKPDYRDATMIDDEEIKDIDTLKKRFKELLERDENRYIDLCFAIADLWTSDECTVMAKSESEAIREMVAYQLNCPKTVLQELANDTCEMVSEAAKIAIADI